jgi:hypothetical protein
VIKENEITAVIDSCSPEEKNKVVSADKDKNVTRKNELGRIIEEDKLKGSCVIWRMTEHNDENEH